MMIKQSIILPARLLLLAGLVFIPVIGLSAQADIPSKPSEPVSGSPTETPVITDSGSVPDSGAGAIPEVTAPVLTAPRTTGDSVIPSRPAPMPSATAPAGGTTGQVVPVSAPEEDALPYGLIGIISTVVAGALGYGIYKAKTGKQDTENDRCGNIRELLEQKKKELQEMVRNWPAEKIKELGKDAVLGELRKDGTARKILDTAGEIQEKYGRLKETVELLQKRYDLCMIKLPSGGDTFKGIIAGNSLKDEKILENLRVEKTYHVENRRLHDVAVSKEQIEKLGQYLNDGPWYMRFWQEGGDDVVVVFKDKNFKIKSSDTSTWTEAAEYGKQRGIAQGDLDFSIK